MNALLAVDQGTTSSRAIVFDLKGRKLGSAQRELPQAYPQSGWVEHDAEGIWKDTLNCCRDALADAGIDASKIAGIGITNQRETTVVWDRASGQPIAPAIVWQDRRTADVCDSLRTPDNEALLSERSGLLLDPYFSASKIAWLLDHVDGARARAEAGELAFGTIDSWLIWNFTGGRSHVTDATNACRTALFDIHRQCWDDELCALFRVPKAMLPEVHDSAAEFGHCEADLLGAAVPIRAVLGDQQAATVGQACFQTGMLKSTYGTGCFIVLNTGKQATQSKHRLLTTVAYRLDGETTYALEGSIFVAGAAVQWLRDAMRLVEHAGETESIARSIDSTRGVYLVPAFTGLGAPYWDPMARGAIVGLTRDSGIAHIVRAALESVCYQTRDLFEAMAQDATLPTELRIDGGMVANDWMAQFLADTLQVPVERPEVIETTALGAAYFAGLQAGLYSGLDEIGDLWVAERRFDPRMERSQADSLYAGWKTAVERVRTR